ncbi:MAG: hypothetical protein WAZ19_02385 [Anaerolineae bacterium]|jgi:hypothetical protein
MKVVRVGNINYRAKYCTRRDGVNLYYWQYQIILFGLIPLWWETYLGTFSLGWIEKSIQEELDNLRNADGFVDLNIK